MNKNNEITDFLALHNALKNCEDTTGRPIYFVECFWLKLELFRYYGSTRKEEMERAFCWISNAPLVEWNGMLTCLLRSNCKTLKEARELYDYLL